MNRANLLALACLVAGIGCVAYGTLLFSLPVVAGPDATLTMIEESPTTGRMPPTPLMEPWVREAPGLFWLVGVAFCSVPGGLFGLTGLLIRHLVAKPREQQSIRHADAEPEREAGLQWLLRECVESTGTDDEGGRSARIYQAAIRIVPTLDPARGARFRLFLRESGLEPEGFAPAVTADALVAPSFAAGKKLARLMILLLLALTFVTVLWGGLCALFVQRIQEQMGWTAQSHDPLFILLVVWCFAGLLLLSVLGVHHLSRIDRRIEGHWVRGFAASCERLLGGVRNCLERVGEVQDRRRPEASALRRGLILSSLRGLDGGRRRTLMMLAREFGALTSATGLSGADLREADLSGLELNGLDLRGAHLHGASLAGANLAGAIMDDADLRSADLRGANLRSACLRRSHLQESRLHRTFLADADLRGAHLEGANLWEADLTGAELAGASVRPEQLRGARGWERPATPVAREG